MTGSQIAFRLREARRAAGLTQEQAASLLGLNPMTVSKRERGVLGISAEDFEAVLAAYRSHQDQATRQLSQTVPRGTNPARVAERESAEFGAGDESWSPNPALVSKIPKRAYDVAIAYCRRLQSAGVPADEIESYERLMIDPRYITRNKRTSRELSPEDWIMLIERSWDAIREAMSWRGIDV